MVSVEDVNRVINVSLLSAHRSDEKPFVMDLTE